MRVVTQIQKHNANQVQRTLVEGKKASRKDSPAIHEAAQIVGEFIAMKNSETGKGTVKLEDVIKSYKPDYLKKRGMV